MISPQVSDVDTGTAPKTCRYRSWPVGNPLHFVFCGRPAEVAFGVVRLCGCPSTPVTWSCEQHFTSGKLDCRFCDARGTTRRTEPVRLSAVHQ